MRRTVATDRAPKAVGPYSQAVVGGGLVWVSGQIPIDPGTGRLVEGAIEDEARRALDNVRAVLEAAGSGLDRVLRATVYLTDLAHFEAVNRVYAEFFGEQAPPARACVQVAALPKGARVEVDAVATVS
jgi:2-iminobutanoate/2-iminopropanoate deaminase